MRHKKLKLCALLLLGLGLTGLQAQKMYVKEKVGTQTAYLLTDIKKMSFSSGNIAIQKTDGNSNQFALSGLRYLNFNDLSIGIGRSATAQKNSEMQVYPNPVVDVLNIQAQLPALNQKGKIEILSIVGKVVYSQEVNSHENVYHIDATSLPKGLYLCRLSIGSVIETSKFIKQ